MDATAKAAIGAGNDILAADDVGVANDTIGDDLRMLHDVGGMIVIAMTLITLSGNIMSFSLGATAAASGVVFVLAANAANPGVGLIAAVATGAAISGVQGLVIGSVRANSIIVSIATLTLVYGTVTALTENETIYGHFGSDLGLAGSIFRMPTEFVVFLVVLVASELLLNFTVRGRHLVMVGANAQAAEAAGVRIAEVTVITYVAAGICAAVTGTMLALRYGLANMEFGAGYDYNAIAAVLVGGTAISGGSGSVLRSFFGLVVIATVQVLLVLWGLSSSGSIWSRPDHARGDHAANNGDVERAADGGVVEKAVTTLFRRSQIVRPLALFIASVALLAIVDGGQGRVLSLATANNALQTFATLGPLTLGLGLTMLVGEFDLSVVGLFALAGCIAVLTGAAHPVLGIVAALAVGLAIGLAQGLVIVRLKLSSVGVTLGGMLTCDGLALVITGNQQLPYDNLPVSIWMGETYAVVFTPRAIVAVALVVLAGVTMIYPAWPRYHRHRKQPPGRSYCGSRRRLDCYRQLRLLGAHDQPFGRTPYLQPCVSIPLGTFRCSGPGRRGGDHWWRIADGWHRPPAGRRAWCSGSGGAARGPERTGSAAFRQRYDDRSCSIDGGRTGRTRPCAHNLADSPAGGVFREIRIIEPVSELTRRLV
jgi:ribose/xylose/arabinose/galactoside ABC-type transport system permease subunit